jgi:hypothetical protein
VVKKNKFIKTGLNICKMQTHQPYIIVNLGNVGTGEREEELGERVTYLANLLGKYSREEVVIYGIDVNPWKPNHPLLEQIEADFLTGLKEFPDNSIDVIESQVAFGYYGPPDCLQQTPREYYDNLILQIRRTLAPGGIFKAVASSTAVEYISDLFDAHSLEYTIRLLNAKEKNMSYYIRSHGDVILSYTE